MTPPTPSATPAHDPYRALRLPDFRRFIAALFALTVATQIQVIVVSWQIYDATRDPFALGLIGLAEAVPFIGLVLYSGHVADRLNRRTIAMWSLGLMAVCSLALLAFALVPSFIERHGVWPYYAVIALSGVARSFLQPARQALGTELVPRELYANAVTWRSSTWQTAAVAGPALGGLLYGFAGPTVAYFVQALLVLVALVIFAGIRYVPGPSIHSAVGVIQSVASGLRFVRGEPILLGALTLDLFSVLLGGAEALLPVFADQVLHVGPQGLGLLRAAPAVGAVAMSLLLAHRPPFRRAGPTLLASVAIFALCIVGFGLSRNVFLSGAFLVVSGMADNVSVIIRGVLLQTLTPVHMLGRVSAVNSVFIGSSNEIGAFESGVMARWLGLVPSVVLGGLLSLGVVGVVAVAIPRLRRLGPMER